MAERCQPLRRIAAGARSPSRRWMMKSFWSGWFAWGCAWAPRVTRCARFASAVSMIATAAAHAAASGAETTDRSLLGPSERVYQYDLAGPRLGATFAPNGAVT